VARAEKCKEVEQFPIKFTLTMNKCWHIRGSKWDKYVADFRGIGNVNEYKRVWRV